MEIKCKFHKIPIKGISRWHLGMTLSSLTSKNPEWNNYTISYHKVETETGGNNTQNLQDYLFKVICILFHKFNAASSSMY